MFPALGGPGLITEAGRNEDGALRRARPQHEGKQAHYLIARSCVYFRSQRLGFGLGGKEVLGFVEAEAQDLSIQVVILIPQFMILLRVRTKAT